MAVCPTVQLSVEEVLGFIEAKGEETDQAAEQLERLLFILHTLVSHRDGAKITKPEAVCQVLRRIQMTHIPLICYAILLLFILFIHVYRRFCG